MVLSWRGHALNSPILTCYLDRHYIHILLNVSRLNCHFQFNNHRVNHLANDFFFFLNPRSPYIPLSQLSSIKILEMINPRWGYHHRWSRSMVGILSWQLLRSIDFPTIDWIFEFHPLKMTFWMHGCSKAWLIRWTTHGVDSPHWWLDFHCSHCYGSPYWCLVLIVTQKITFGVSHASKNRLLLGWFFFF